MIKTFFIAAALIVFSAPYQTATAFDPRCPVATEQRARALAEKAAAFLKAHGSDKAFAAFTARTDGFGAGDLYVFVFDLLGTLRASGGWPGHVGSTVIGPGSDGGGLYYRFRRLALAKPGRGWIHYNWYSPCTRTMQPKMTYIIRVGSFIVGVGAYKVPGV